jgi:CPA2 family monovalent cation:H+ antiporter-2
VHEAHHFLVNLALVLCVAGFTTALFRRLRQPVVLGYLLAGAIVSPHTPLPLFADEATIQALSELGVILLMFSLGLEFSLAKLLRVGPTAGLVAAIQCGLMLWLGYTTGQLLGWTALESVFTGALLSISSTTIIVKAFAEQQVRGTLAEIVFGVLIVEDLIAILLLTVLTAVSSGARLGAGDLAATTGRLLAFLAVSIGGGLLVVPRLVRFVVGLDRPETTVVASVGLCFAFALVADAVGYSVALGAFLAGALVAESGEGVRVERLVQPVTDIFAAIFFVAVGMMIEPALVAEHWGAVAALTAVVVLGKVGGVVVGVFLTGRGIRTSIQAGMSLAQIGEFSFLIAGVGLATGATGHFLYPIAVSVSAATTFLTPWLIRASDPVAAWVDARLPKPIQTFAALYGSWLEKLRSRPREPSVGRRIRRLGRLLILDASLLALIVVAAALWGSNAARWLGRVARACSELGGIAVVAVAALLAAPFCLGIARCTAALSGTLAALALPPAREKVDLAVAPRRALVVMLELAILLAIGVPLVALTQPFLPAFPGAVLMASLILLLGLSLWRSASDLQQHARAGAQAIVEVLARQLATRSAPAIHPSPGAEGELEALDRLLPGLGAPVAVRVQPGTRAAGRTLAELDLRGLTGATVLAIAREHAGVLTPTGRETLEGGDLLAIAGTAEAVESARQLLAEAAEAPPPGEGAPGREAPRAGAGSADRRYP